MADFVRVHLDDGTEVLFEARESDLVQAHSTGADVQELEAAGVRLDAIAAAAHTVATSLRDRMTPDDLQLEIGVGLSGEVGWFFAKSALDASLKVTLTWNHTKAGVEGVTG